MFLKLAIVILFIAVVASLTSGLVFLLKDLEVSHAKRTTYALGIRVTLAMILMGLIAYGIQSGQLNNNAPWDRQATTPSVTNQN